MKPNKLVKLKTFDDNFQCRIVCIQPIKKKTKGEAAIELLKLIAADRTPFYYHQEVKEVLEMPE